MTRTISFSSTTIVALVLGAGAFLSAAPATAAGNYCLSSDANNDCSFTSRAQCEATASGGLGECNMVVPAPVMRGRCAR